MSSSSSPATYPHVPWSRQLVNLLGCLLIFPLYRAAAVNTLWPATVDLLISICLAELCRFTNEGRRIAWRRQLQGLPLAGWSWSPSSSSSSPKEDVEKGGVGGGGGDPGGGGFFWTGGASSTASLSLSSSSLSSSSHVVPAPVAEAMASIVGWREDPELWERCLESYKEASGCRFVLVGIDGNEADDKEMVDIFKKVYPDRSLVLSLPEPLGELANTLRARELRARQKLAHHKDDSHHLRRRHGRVITQEDEDDINDMALQSVLATARNHLEDALARHPGDAHIGGPEGIRYLLVNQRHLHKKGIMFTAFVFSSILADMLGIDFVWTSDSDTIVLPDSVEGTINTIAGDPRAGGASSGLIVHNVSETLVTKLASVIYWCELYLTRSLPGSVAVSDCQSGPSAAFRLSAIRPILVSWYNQTVFGKRMIVNEDRHLTTLLLLRGWRVIYAGDIMTATETPTTLVRWIRQQVRWARAQHIESLLLPRVYLVNHPFLFLSAVRRELAHLVVFVQCLLYLVPTTTSHGHNHSLLAFNMPDLVMRIVGMALYNFLRNPDRQAASALLWMVPGLLFYNVPLPAVEAWALVTMTADTWGNSMRSGTEIAKKDGLRKRWFESGFFVVWIGAVGAMLAKWTASRMLWAAGQTLMSEVVAAAVCAAVTWKLTIQDA